MPWQTDTRKIINTKMFLNLIDQFTVWHIRILNLFDDPEGWFKAHKITLPNYMAAGLINVIQAAYPELSSQQDFCDILWD